MHSIIRTKKHKSIASLKTRENHTYRRIDTPNADPEKSKKNKLLFGQTDYATGLENFLDDYKKEKHIRKDGVLAVEYLLTASPEFFDTGPKNERDDRLKKWCDSQIDFMKKKHGEKNILCMFLHLDEKTPHIETFVVPIDPKGKLNCKHFLGGKNKLRELQTDYALHNASFDLKRGLTGSKATHVQVQKFYEQIKSKSKVTNDDLMKAVKIETPSISERLDPTVFLAVQQKKIFERITKLFAGTVYENKLIAQAKKILRDWKRSEDDAQKVKYKLESEKEVLQEKINRQVKSILMLDTLKTENKDLQKHVNNIEVENQLLKNKLSPKPKTLDI
ncbi:MAG: plasmid recombination protein [Bdellovibrionaceae bacterium]|nr:plasmid recombination protein [Pseudobdellovibrionaceae bacterium]